MGETEPGNEFIKVAEVKNIREREAKLFGAAGGRLRVPA
jgi:hypothetical protein